MNQNSQQKQRIPNRGKCNGKAALAAIAVVVAAWLLPAALTAQPYDITFTGDGEATAVETVTVDNLTRGTMLTLAGDETLRLGTAGDPTGIDDMLNNGRLPIKVYPNPSVAMAYAVFTVPQKGQVTLSVTDNVGRTLKRFATTLPEGEYTFELPGMGHGVFVVMAQATGFNGSGKWLSQGGDGTGAIRRVDSAPIQTKAANDHNDTPTELKAGNVKTMEDFKAGDLLRFRGKAGDCSTIVMLKPTANKAVNFHFIKCTDGNGNQYPIVQIGNTWWMAENLKASKTGSGLGMEQATKTEQWTKQGAKTMAYADFATTTTTTQQAYYNSAAAVAAAPAGWHVPSKAEFDALATELGGTSTAGGKMKATGSSALWDNTNTGATNESGFGAYGAGYLAVTGTLTDKGTAAIYRTSDDKIAKLSASAAGVQYTDAVAKAGYTVRCVLGDPPAPEIKTDYQMLQELFGNQISAGDPSSGPFGDNFVFKSNKKQLYITGENIGTAFPELWKINTKPNINPEYVNIDINTVTSGWYTGQLKKAVAQTKENGNQAMVFGVWKEETKIGRTNGTMYPDVHYWYYTGFAGKGNITLHVIERIVENGEEKYKEKKVPLNVEFEMPELFKFSGRSFSLMDMWATGYDPDRFDEDPAAQAAILSWFFQLRAGDVNNDGVDDILVSIGRKLAIFDGKSYEKIAEKDFSNEFGLQATDPLMIRAEVGDIDGDRKNDLVIATSSGKTTSLPKMHVYYGIDNFLSDLSKAKETVIDLNHDDGMHPRFANIAIGDIDGDQVDEIVVGLKTLKDAGNRNYSIKYWKYSDGQLNVNAERTDVDFQQCNMEALTLARLRGNVFPCDVITSNQVLKFEGGRFVRLDESKPYMLTDFANHQVYADHIVAGNFDKNKEGREQVYFLKAWEVDNPVVNEVLCREARLCRFFIADDQQRRLDHDLPVYQFDNLSNVSTVDGIFPVICAIGVIDDDPKLKFVKYEQVYTKPIIEAVLMAAPYYAETGNEADASTSWALSKWTEQAHEISSSIKTSLIFGAEQKYSVMGVEIGGWELETQLSNTNTIGFGKTKTIDYSTSYTTSANHAVVLTTIPHDAYIYEVVNREQKDNDGLVTIFRAKDPVTTIVTLDDYYKLFGNNKEAPKLTEITFPTVGDPSKYPTAAPGGSLVGNNASSPKSGGTSISSGITTTEETSRSVGTEIGISVEFIGQLGPVKVGAGLELSTNFNYTRTVGTGSSVSGTVPPVESFGLFNWNILWYTKDIAYPSGGSVKAPVINYLVKKQ